MGERTHHLQLEHQPTQAYTDRVMSNFPVIWRPNEHADEYIVYIEDAEEVCRNPFVLLALCRSRARVASTGKAKTWSLVLRCLSCNTRGLGAFSTARMLELTLLSHPVEQVEGR